MKQEMKLTKWDNYLHQKPDFKPKWTKANSDQANLQGIAQEALTIFKEYCDMCTTACNSPHCIEVERAVLDAVCQDEEVTATSFAEWQELCSNSKKASTATILKEVPDLQAWSDKDSDNDDESREQASV